MEEPRNLRHSGGEPLGRQCHVSLQINHEAIRAPSPNRFDGGIGVPRHVQGHCPARAQGVGSDFVGVESQLIKPHNTGIFPQGGHDAATGDTRGFWSGI